jgi:hypothetical protein
MWRSRLSRLFFLLLVCGVLLAGIGLVWIKQMAVPDDAEYVSSAACLECHKDEHQGWSGSLHPKMMRRVDVPGVVVADFSSEDGAAPFAAESAVWAIGSRWEQQFMGHDGDTETLLPGAWLVADRSWKKQGWDGWQVPVPLRRCHGCHTVGLDVDDGTFVEPGIGCESCHGAGGWHVKTLGIGRIYSSIDAQVCGQCHARGRSHDGRYFFPTNYRPGDDLLKHFKFSEPSYGQNSSHWWGNGRERKRHQEFAAWQRGGHADSLQSLLKDYDGRYGEVDHSCLRCHVGEAALGMDVDMAALEDGDLSGITCAVCHNVHGGLDQPRLGCVACHDNGAYHHRDETLAEHIPCSAAAEVSCVNCHMPLTVKNGGAFTLHSHTPGIVNPLDTEQWGVPSSCANGGCHADRDVAWLQAAFEQHYGVPE